MKECDVSWSTLWMDGGPEGRMLVSLAAAMALATVNALAHVHLEWVTSVTRRSPVLTAGMSPCLGGSPRGLYHPCFLRGSSTPRPPSPVLSKDPFLWTRAHTSASALMNLNADKPKNFGQGWSRGGAECNSYPQGLCFCVTVNAV